jgi:hypothetical protein
MPYTNVAKPTNTTYTKINTQGFQTYDDSLVAYDASDVYYDGFNPNMYTNVSKPSSTSYTNVAKPTTP